MPLKNTLLHTAVVFWILCLFRSSLGWLWIFICIIWLLRLQGRYVLLTCMLLCWMQVRISATSLSAPPPSTITVTIQEIKSNYVLAAYEKETILLYDANKVSFGDTLQVDVECSAMNGQKNFHQFSFSDWTKRRNIHYGCTIKKQIMLEESKSFRSVIFQHINQMEEKEKNWLLNTLYGIQEEEQEVSYLISSSGMHMSFACTMLEKFFSLWLSAGCCQIASLLLLICFGNCIVWRDALLRILCFRFASFAFQTYSSKDRLGIGMMLMLILLPYTAGEITFVLPVVFRFCFLFNIQKRSKRLVSMLVLLPLQFYYFNEVDGIQLFLFPLLRKGYGIAFLMALMYLLCSFSLFYILGQQLLAILTWLQSFTFPLYYASSLLFLFIWFYYGFKWLAERTNRHRVILVGMLLYTQIAPYLKPYMEIMMLDVGQGDCTLISLPFQQGNILIDVAGSKQRNLPEEVIVPVLHALGIRSIDLVIITHDDFDHSGGLQQLEKLIEVKQVVTKKQESISFGNTTLSFLLTEKTYADTNDNSILTYLDAYDTRMLFMGDAGKQVEADLMKEYPNLQADILKVGHHGSKTSSSISFLHQLHPSYALISCGIHNFYGHPSPETIASLQQESIQILDTPQKGAISIKLTNFIRFYKTATNEFGIIR